MSETVLHKEMENIKEVINDGKVYHFRFIILFLIEV